jgi:hypothetical protein
MTRTGHAGGRRSLRYSLVTVAGFRFALVLENGEPADPGVFPTIIPTWNVGDTFLAGSELQRFRIVAIETEYDEDAAFVWVVEPVESS